MKTAILNITCKDKKGLVAAVSNFIFENKGNIVNLDQYTDTEHKMFFMRIEWDLSNFTIPAHKLDNTVNNFIKTNKFAGSYELFFSNVKPRMAIFVSKYDHCLYDLLLRHKAGELNCEIPLIISNHKDLKYIADTFGIDFKYIPVTKSSKTAQEKKEIELLKKYKINFIVLARYMQIISKTLLSEYSNKIINIHHSFLPAFKGAKPYHQAYEKGVKIIGATSHFINEKLDQGPIIAQDVATISHKDTVDDLIVKGRDIERKVLANAVRLFIDHRLFVCGKRTISL